MSTNQYGKSGGFFATGVVVDRMDPTESGHHKVTWNIGGTNQDGLSNDELPWSRTMFPSHNPSLNQTGGPHTGLRPGSTVFGYSMDGQDWIIMGSMPKAGRGEPDGSPTYDSDIPQPAKSKDREGNTYDVPDQPRYGDVAHRYAGPDSPPGDGSSGGDSGGSNGEKKSIIKYAQDEGGKFQIAARYAGIPDPIGLMDREITHESA